MQALSSRHCHPCVEAGLSADRLTLPGLHHADDSDFICQFWPEYCFTMRLVAEKAVYFSIVDDEMRPRVFFSFDRDNDLYRACEVILSVRSMVSLCDGFGLSY